MTTRERDEDRALRPKTLAEATGQDDVRSNLAVYTQSARGRGEPLDHVLFTGPAGLGKTTMAEILANEMGCRIVTINAPALKTKAELVSILMSIGRGDMLFIDEIHALDLKIAEVLYSALEDYRLNIVAGNQAITLPVEPFTLVGATTDAGKMPRPLRDRFGIVCEMQPYGTEELAGIVTKSAAKLGVAIERSGALELARRSRGTPRLANRTLRRVRDFAEVLGRPIDDQVATMACERIGVDARGLDKTARKYLQILVNKGTPVALSTVTSMLGETKNVVEDNVEPFLLSIGFIEKTGRGRVATEAGRAHLLAAA